MVLPDSREFFLCVVVQVGLLLRLHFDYLITKVRGIMKFIGKKTYPIQKVFMSDKAGLSSQGDHTSLYTSSLALSTVEIVCTPG